MRVHFVSCVLLGNAKVFVSLCFAGRHFDLVCPLIDDSRSPPALNLHAKEFHEASAFESESEAEIATAKEALELIERRITEAEEAVAALLRISPLKPLRVRAHLLSFSLFSVFYPFREGGGETGVSKPCRRKMSGLPFLNDG